MPAMPFAFHFYHTPNATVKRTCTLNSRRLTRNVSGYCPAIKTIDFLKPQLNFLLKLRTLKTKLY